MRIQIASDLHLEFLPERFRRGGQAPTITPVPDADVLVLAGDIAKKANALKAFTGWPVPVVYVYGNHEMYGQHLHQHVDHLRKEAQIYGIHFLEREAVELAGVRFLGCALWTDFELFGDAPAAMDMAGKSMNDYRVIKTHYRALQPVDTRNLHRKSRAWLEEELAKPFAGKTVVVTHMGPHRQSLPDEYQDDVLSASYVSDLSALMGPAALWIHGHVHASVDFVIAGTRVLANPRGYPMNIPKALEDVKWENITFDPALVVEV
jgi:Icc-related predicted phosphoesterase